MPAPVGFLDGIMKRLEALPGDRRLKGVGDDDILADKSTRTAIHPPRRIECQSWIVQPRLGPSAKFMRDACRQGKGTNSTVRPIQRTTTLGRKPKQPPRRFLCEDLPSPSAPAPDLAEAFRPASSTIVGSSSRSSSRRLVCNVSRPNQWRPSGCCFRTGHDSLDLK